MVYGPTSHNRTVYATPPVGGLVFRSLGHFAPLLRRGTLHSHAHSRHIWAARNPTGFFIVPPKRRKQPERYVQFVRISFFYSIYLFYYSFKIFTV